MNYVYAGQKSKGLQASDTLLGASPDCSYLLDDLSLVRSAGQACVCHYLKHLLLAARGPCAL